MYDTCPFNGGQIYYSLNWFQPYAVNRNVRAFSSSDYYNSCSSIMSVPYNSFGYQNPQTGSAYVGIICYSPSLDSYREYIEAKLIIPLKKNYTYCVDFYVSLVDTSSYSMNRLGVYFSADSVILDHSIPASTPPFLLSYKPQIENDSTILLNDKINWMKISESYTAKGDEQYITIGNFYDNASTTVQSETGNASYAYYYIDDVSIVLCDSTKDTTSTLYIPNAFSPNGDGKNDVFKAEGKNISEFNAQIYNRWGQLIYESNNLQAWWNGEYKGCPVSEGVYVYSITAKGVDGIEHKKRGTILLIR